jgi:hypothetical protein
MLTVQPPDRGASITDPSGLQPAQDSLNSASGNAKAVLSLREILVPMIEVVKPSLIYGRERTDSRRAPVHPRISASCFAPNPVPG